MRKTKAGEWPGVRRFLDHTLNLLLAALLLLGGLPQVEVRHRHAHGRGSHHHHHHGDSHGSKAEHFTSDPIHDHEDQDHTRSDADGLVVLLSPRIGPAFPALSEGEDWHVHSAWLGELIRGTLPVSDRGGDEVGQAVGAHTAEFTATQDGSAPLQDPLGLSLLKCLHGPPPWLVPADPVPRNLRSLLDRRPPRLLCDAARHERSGVQLT